MRVIELFLDHPEAILETIALIMLAAIAYGIYGAWL